MVFLFLIQSFKEHFKTCFFILKDLEDILQHFESVNWWIGEFVFLCYEQITNKKGKKNCAIIFNFSKMKIKRKSWFSFLDKSGL